MQKIKLFIRLYVVVLLPFALLADFINRKILKRFHVVAITFHDIAERDYPKFQRIINFLVNRYDFITPEQFDQYKRGQLKLKNTSLLVTFDDGFSSSKTVTEKFLEPLGIRAVFFCCPGFVGLGEKEARNFVANNIYTGTRRPEDILPEELPMNDDELREIVKKGHIVGGHTIHHISLATISDNAVLEKEVLSCKVFFKEKFGLDITWFAFPFGGMPYINQAGLGVIKKGYQYCFSGVRGVITTETHPMALTRQSVTITEPYLLQLAIFLGATNFLHGKKRKDLVTMAN